MKNVGTYIIAIILSALISLAVVSYIKPSASTESKKQSEKTTFERVSESGVLRCAYISYAPFFMKDPATNEFTGIFHDLTEEAAKDLKLKVEWAEEVSFQTMIAGLGERYDAICSGLWILPNEAMHASFANPVFFNGVGVYVRKGDNRFSNNLNAINNPDIKIATIDGEISSIIAAEQFPDAQVVSMPNLTDVSSLLLNVQTGKADVAFVATDVANNYLAKNPDALENITPDNPIRLFASTWAFPVHDNELASAFSASVLHMLTSGFVDRTLDKYQKTPADFYRINKPYR